MKKKLVSIAIAILMLLPATAKAEEGIAINPENFPDLAFRSLVSMNYDTDNDSILSPAEIQGATDLSLRQEDFGLSKPVSLKGLNHLTNLKYIDFTGTRIKNAKFGKLSELEVLYLSGCRVRKLDVGNNLLLRDLRCDNNKIKDIKGIANCKQLEYLNCENNLISTLSVTGLRKLVTLKSGNNTIKRLNLKRCHSLTELYHTDEFLKQVRLSKKCKLTTLEVSKKVKIK